MLRTWHIEVYLAIANDPTFSQLREQRRNDLASQLTAMMALINPKIDKQVLRAEICEEILDPAIAMAYQMHTSLNEFSVEWTSYQPQTSEQRLTAALRGFKDFEFVDLLQNGRKLNAQPVENVRYLLDIFPQVVVKTHDKTTGPAVLKVLQRAKVLVAVGQEVDEVPVLANGADATIFSWLSKAVAARSA